MNTDIKTFSNIVTPPDLLDSPLEDTIVLVDPDYREIEDLALYLKISKNAYTVYIYREEMKDIDWLTKTVKRSNACIINSVENELSPIKDKLALDKNSWHYGQKRFLLSMDRYIQKPIDYFVHHSTTI